MAFFKKNKMLEILLKESSLMFGVGVYGLIGQ